MNKELLKKLCDEHSFHLSKIGLYLKIVSKRGTYYILDIDHEGRKIKLYHANEYNSAGKHFHGEHKNIEDVIKSIVSHDNIYNVGSRNNKLTRITDLFNQLHTSA